MEIFEEQNFQITFASTKLFSGHATNTKHSISMKLANFDGLSFPTLIV